MIFVIIVMSTLILFDTLWWWRADRWARNRVKRRGWRALVGAWALFQIGFIFFAIFSRLVSPELDAATPRAILSVSFIWHLIILPGALVMMLGEGVGRSILGLGRWVWTKVASAKPQAGEAREVASVPGDASVREDASVGKVNSVVEHALSRRAFLGTTIATVPPLVTVLATGRAMATVEDFRVRRLDVVFPGLPVDLDGLSIAHVTDVHVGRFTRGKVLGKIAEATNALRPDLVMMTGDLINISIEDLPAAIELVKKMDARFGVYLCEGNHDRIDDGVRFEREVKASGIPLLLDEIAPLRVKGHPVDVLGVKWARGRAGYNPDALANLAARRRDGAWSVLLAHHPHAFDTARTLDIPLTLAGHTHGGQLHLSEQLGFGPFMYRYWSGLYQKPDENHAACVVSNGVGNWFPLRINAPAEIVHVVLHRA